MLGKVAVGEKVVLASERSEVKVPAALFTPYTGEYALNPKITATITLEGEQLFTQLTGQPKFPMFAESPTKFFLKVVDAQMEFEKDAGGKITGLILYQNGRESKPPASNQMRRSFQPPRKNITIPITAIQPSAIGMDVNTPRTCMFMP